MEEGKGEVENVNRGGPILPSLTIDFPRPSCALYHPSDNNRTTTDDANPITVPPPGAAR